MGVGDFLKRLRVLLTRQEIVPERLPGATAVVIDVFMATTTLLTILENGARDVYPVASLEEADEVAAKLDAESVLRGGEQDAARIEGYDHGPFPEEYAPEVVEEQGRDLRDHQRHPRRRRRGPGGHGPAGNPAQRPGRSPLSGRIGDGVHLLRLRRLCGTLHRRGFPRRGHDPLVHGRGGLAPERRRLAGPRLRRAPRRRLLRRAETEPGRTMVRRERSDGNLRLRGRRRGERPRPRGRRGKTPPRRTRRSQGGTT